MTGLGVCYLSVRMERRTSPGRRKEIAIDLPLLDPVGRVSSSPIGLALSSYHVDIYLLRQSL